MIAIHQSVKSLVAENMGCTPRKVVSILNMVSRLSNLTKINIATCSVIGSISNKYANLFSGTVSTNIN